MELIKGLSARRILNSRGDYTIELEMWTKDHCVTASVPSGKSKGRYEAVEVSADQAVKNLQKIKPKIVGLDPCNQAMIDKLLMKLDNTTNKSRLGANTTLAVSIAANKLSAKIQGCQVYELYSGCKAPKLYLNLINGGLHAGNKLAFQEYHVIPLVKQVDQAIDMSINLYHELRKELIKHYGRMSINVGDEGGYAPPMTLVEQPLKLLQKIIKRLGYSKVRLGLDCAASSFYKKGKYLVDGRALTNDGLIKFYERLVKDYDLYSIEDPLEENDFKGFAELRSRVKARVVGDDLLVTNKERIVKAVNERSCDDLLLKPNQRGTLYEACKAAAYAFSNGLGVIVSHRSGETNDSFIADLAVGLEAGLKTGAPARGERVSKYNRLLEIFHA